MEKKKAPRPSQATASLQGRKIDEEIIQRNDFYRNGYRQLLLISAILTVCLVLMVTAVLVLAQRTPETKVVAVDEYGRLTPIVPLSEPYVTPSTLVSFVQEIALTPYTVNYRNYRDQINRIQPMFTAEGFDGFIKAYLKSDILILMEQEQRLLTATPITAPRITRQGNIEGVYRWRLELPIRVTMESHRDQRTADLLVQIDIARVSMNQNPRGIAATSMHTSIHTGRR